MIIDFPHISILISMIIGIIMILIIRSYDIYEKEPFSIMFITFFLGGISSVLFSTLFYQIVSLLGIGSDSIKTILGSFLIIGPIEEISKFAGLLLTYPFYKKYLNELSDGVVYISCVALGFSIIENYFYANSGIHNEHLLFFRLLISTPSHISISCFIGYAFFRHKREKKAPTIVLWAILISILFHGLYDAIIFTEYLRFLNVACVYYLFYQLLKIIQISNINSPFRPVFSNMFKIRIYDKKEKIECPYCKSNSEKIIFKNFFFTAYKCDDCGYYISSIKDIYMIFKHFAPEHKDLSKEIYPKELEGGDIFYSIYACTYFNRGSRIGFFKIEDVSKKIDFINNLTIESFYRSKLIPMKLYNKILK